MSTLLQEMYLLLHIQKIQTLPYHLQTDGFVEQFNGTLKGMLREFVRSGTSICRICFFAYREVPQESTGLMNKGRGRSTDLRN